MTDSPSIAGSCEPCKRKKCKCDRRLYVAPLQQPGLWTQLTSPDQRVANVPRHQVANIPNSAKGRGIPTGYLNALEQRLTETEIALSHALWEIRSLQAPDSLVMPKPNPAAFTSRSDNVSKLTRLTEWKTFPLRSAQDVETWWQQVAIASTQEQVDIPTRTGPFPTTTASGSRADGIPRSSPYGGLIESRQHISLPSISQPNFEFELPIDSRISNEHHDVPAPVLSNRQANISDQGPESMSQRHYSLPHADDAAGAGAGSYNYQNSSMYQDQTRMWSTDTQAHEIMSRPLLNSPGTEKPVARAQKLAKSLNSTYY
ncbi:hypothetical protein BP6252_11394 [Coleophoma cylindrospora]|uniref:Zn(2)-C6 fungal-type domain-containing protein n=1 Tax=Coleophoma cylindrospora TaxID=1849047 RepID=A0A3D8QJR6_9HELO|nr:hypothetical protein BP6252_11394 [Coleophoma cylindrospora]